MYNQPDIATPEPAALPDPNAPSNAGLCHGFTTILTTHKMAPTAPSKRTTARSKVRSRLSATGPTAPKTFRPSAIIADSFLNTKKDKRIIKHSAFVSRISKATAPTKKRRRPSKKLVATLESLGDALDDITHEMEEGGMMDKEQAAMGRVRHKSLKSRPGALKRKEKVVKGEMERFGRSLAQLAMVKGESKEGEAAAAVEGMEVEKEEKSEQQAATSNRWAALRGFISSTMEQNPAFLKKT
ncbi:ribosome biogenesis protein SLX9-domain-containing protein [Cercophora newfieldiana]|uniref:Ribosome biogenesis protein SLX9 n=1 Tax=Cercophora newfieldiana TaxID=92897 RepID=A0AA39YR25_9PEZI|nr:ribosome biogenesis protein SLX9-domain-containing protein [Cercophora newfieldiana]